MVWTHTEHKKAHDAEINHVTATSLGESIYILTFCLDGNIKIWRSTKDNQAEIKPTATLMFGSNLQEAFKLFPINKRFIMLLTGGFDKNMHVYTIDTHLDGDESIQYHTS